MEAIFKGIFDGELAPVISVGSFLLCLAVSLVIGVVLAVAYMFRSRYTKSFVLTLSLLPAVVCVVIMMVNGNIGAGVAVAGAFSLVRFRSAPGSAKEIVAIFLAMGAGLVAGMGYLAYAVLFTVIMCAFFVLYSLIRVGERKSDALYKTVKITIPEDLDYSDVFTDIFERYASEFELVKVKTHNMGSMFRLTYNITMLKDASEKAFIDELRTRNGNLEIMLSRQEVNQNEL